MRRSFFDIGVNGSNLSWQSAFLTGPCFTQVPMKTVLACILNINSGSCMRYLITVYRSYQRNQDNFDSYENKMQIFRTHFNAETLKILHFQYYIYVGHFVLLQRNFKVAWCGWRCERTCRDQTNKWMIMAYWVSMRSLEKASSLSHIYGLITIHYGHLIDW